VTTIALIPAYNEAGSIGRTLTALAAQETPVDRIIVIANNCTDDTAAVAAGHGAEVIVMNDNPHMKAGALNFALKTLLPDLEDTDRVLVQDADSFLDPGFVTATVAALDCGYSAAGGNFRGRGGGGICGAFQRNEYHRYKRETAHKGGKILCITGVGTMLTVSALRAVVRGIADGTLPDSGGGYCYSYTTLTEDNWMTMALRRLGRRVISPKNATMSTEVMLTWRELGKQRLRWKRGAIEDLLSFGVNRKTIAAWLRQLAAFIGVVCSAAYVGLLLAAPWMDGIHFRALFIGITVFYAFERAFTLRGRGWKTSMLSLTLVGEWAYDLFLQAVYVRALAGSALRTSTTW
jgi:cellulose synthase/poly-beta-1,6-N-acetylglucosamine synthase-like glycosyltransferase